MLLIATDEAGYGPKLGPLVIVATAWEIATAERGPAGVDQGDRSTVVPRFLRQAFQPLERPQRCGDIDVVVADSKAVYKPGGGLATLHAIVSTNLHWCGRPEGTWCGCLRRLAAEDWRAIEATPWLVGNGDPPLLDPAATESLRRSWGRNGARPVGIRARVLTAGKFNDACNQGSNKADLLSESTVELVRQMIEQYGGGQESIAVYCDRHGGRRYYGGLLQHRFPNSLVRVLAEDPGHSHYRLAGDPSMAEIDVHFSVKGDSFTPVAMSSIHAKYTRERLMESFNAYFRDHHRGQQPLKPTAGYPADADRFLRAIEPTIRRQRIPLEKLVRQR